MKLFGLEQRKTGQDEVGAALSVVFLPMGTTMENFSASMNKSAALLARRVIFHRSAFKGGTQPPPRPCGAGNSGLSKKL
jgi:hypothetical protein